jgi:predicted AAA+ superfamily ATPase
MGLLKGIDRVRDLLVDNTERFARGLPLTMRCCGARAAWASRP